MTCCLNTVIVRSLTRFRHTNLLAKEGQLVEYQHRPLIDLQCKVTNGLERIRIRLRDGPSFHALKMSLYKDFSDKLVHSGSCRTQTSLAMELYKSAVRSILVFGLIKHSDETDAPRHTIM